MTDSQAGRGDSSKRRSIGKTFWSGLAVLALLAVVGMAYVAMLANRRWGDVLDRRDLLIKEAQGRPTLRHVLRGETVAGRAWEEYELAIRPFRNTKENLWELNSFIQRAKTDRSAVESVVKNHQSEIGHLRLGVQRAEGQHPYQWEKGRDFEWNILPPQYLVNVCVCQARFWEESGRAAEAAWLLLDVCQFAHDTGNNGFLINYVEGLGLYGVALDELHDILLSGKLSTEDLSKVARELEIVERQFPRLSETYLNERFALSADSFLGVGDGPEPAPFWHRATLWRYGFSYRLELAAGIQTLDPYLSGYSDCDLMTWSEAEKRNDEVISRFHGSHNRVLSGAESLFKNSMASSRHRLAQVRILRTGAAFLANGEVLDLGDPFGKRLLRSRDGGKLKIWSVGRTGKDHGGKGLWRMAQDLDIVLEVGVEPAPNKPRDTEDDKTLVKRFLEDHAAATDLRKRGIAAMPALIEARLRNASHPRLRELLDLIFEIKRDSASPEGRKLLESANKTKMTMAFDDNTWEEILQFVRDFTSNNLVVDSPADVSKAKVSLKEGETTMRAVLDKMSIALGLDYDIRYGVVWIAKPERLWAMGKAPPLSRGNRWLDRKLAGDDADIAERLWKLRVTVDVRDQPLPSVVDYLRELTGLNIFIDRASGAETRKRTVTTKFSDVSAADALALVTLPLGLEVDLAGGCVLIVDPTAPPLPKLQLTTQKLEGDDANVLARLKEKGFDLDIEEMPLKDAAELLAQLSGIPFRLEGAIGDSKVSVKVKNTISLYYALDFMLVPAYDARIEKGAVVIWARKKG